MGCEENHDDDGPGGDDVLDQPVLLAEVFPELLQTEKDGHGSEPHPAGGTVPVGSSKLVSTCQYWQDDN